MKSKLCSLTCMAALVFFCLRLLVWLIRAQQAAEATGALYGVAGVGVFQEGAKPAGDRPFPSYLTSVPTGMRQDFW